MQKELFTVEEFKTYLCELIDEAYQSARSEFASEIMFPFSITLKGNDRVEFHPLHKHRERSADTEPVKSHSSP